MTLDVSIRHRLGDFALEVAFETPGGLTALFGPSGSGKSSVVNAIAGLLRPDRGRISLDGRPLLDTERRIEVPAHRRQIGYVFQDARLFPHLTVEQNLRYGRFFAPAPARYADYDGVVDLLGIRPLLARRPALLSGGEKQRVGIGRALLASPHLILMDEPLASLDDARKAEIIPYIQRLRDEMRIPIVYVSHSVAEVSQLATQIVMLADGRVAAAGAAQDVMMRLDMMPAEARAEAGAVIDMEVVAHDDRFELTELRSAGGCWHVRRLRAPVGARVRARIRARDVMLSLEAPVGISALNTQAGEIVEIREVGGPDALVAVECGGDRLISQVTRRSVERLGLVANGKVHLVVKAVTLDSANITPRRVTSETANCAMLASDNKRWNRQCRRCT